MGHRHDGVHLLHARLAVELRAASEYCRLPPLAHAVVHVSPRLTGRKTIPKPADRLLLLAQGGKVGTLDVAKLLLAYARIDTPTRHTLGAERRLEPPGRLKRALKGRNLTT
eukprot:scaffold306409_cov37-Tisochrysis_lutea.AAC.3